MPSSDSLKNATPAKLQSGKAGAAKNEGKGPRHAEIEATLHRRTARAVSQHRHLPRLTGRFTLVTKGMLGDRSDLCWAALEPESGALKLWSHPPQEDASSLDPDELMGFSQSSATPLSCLVGTGSRKSPSAPFKTFNLELLRNVDSNPHFHSVFLGFKGGVNQCLTAHSQETFEEWMEVLLKYDVHSHPEISGPSSPKSHPASKAPADKAKSEPSKQMSLRSIMR